MTKCDFIDLPLLKQVVVRYKCRGCQNIMSKPSFPADKSKRNGISTLCKVCTRAYCAAYRKTKVGVITSIYGSQRASSKRRCHTNPNYSRGELISWCLGQDLFHALYDNWVDSNYDMLDIPSIDRLNDYEPYSFDNIQLMTWRENKAKGHSDEVVGRNKKKSKAVNQYDLNGNLIATYHSTRNASRITGVHQAGISGVCNGKVVKKGYKSNGEPRSGVPKTAGGFIWRFA